MKRSALILLVVGVLMAMAVPSAAKKPPKPPAEPTTYELTMTHRSPYGVATACATSITLVRNGIHFESYEGAVLDIAAGPLAWDGTLIDGCHGNEVSPEYFRITLEDDGTVAMLWIFDVAYTETVVPVGKSGKTKIETVRQDFRMGGPYDEAGTGFLTDATWEVTSTEDGREQITLSDLTGYFTFVHFNSGGHPEIEGNPLMVALENGELAEFTLDITLTEVPAQ